jgi:hypothetical protein
MVGLVKSDFEDNGTAAMKLLDHFALPPALMQPQTTNIVPNIERGVQATSSQACSVSTPAYANLKAALRFTHGRGLSWQAWIAPVPKATKISYEDDDYDRFEQHLVFTGAWDSHSVVAKKLAHIGRF